MKKVFLLFVLAFCMVAHAENEALIIDEKLPNSDKTTINNKTKNSSADWLPYMLDIEQRIKRTWIPPKESDLNSIVVTFTIDRSGRLLNCKIAQSSGVFEADKAALDAIENAAPFKPLPKEFKGDSVPLEFTFQTRYRSFKIK